MIRRLKNLGRAHIIHTRPLPGRKLSGFTLLELLVVLVVVGIMVSMAVLSFGVLGRDRQAEEETRRFWTVLQQAREEAELQVEDIGIYIGTDSYEYLRFEPRKDEWQLIDGDELFQQRKLPEGLRFRLRLEQREVVLKPSLPQRSDKDENKKYPPHVMVLSSGEVMPFELEIERDGAPSLWRVTALANNDLRVEKRGDRDQWGPLLQTKPPPEDDRQKQPTRVSSAR
ncbi:type II secretion system minor pseudopilin GspH [Steroidobacter sp.]|uniref:type II secretion system minor pseudopilin GspH n=1 Tax=Steroidobacter sp. TaxID=1978227 RepID=UPI001A5C51E2|nr:type II secretion system minor pseudopilin GspH [Steroidobacter sp.]MBL8266756.1 type II secretion system minor pseudopilin GspH [Steroidobacter sp.]